MSGVLSVSLAPSKGESGERPVRGRRDWIPVGSHYERGLEAVSFVQHGVSAFVFVLFESRIWFTEVASGLKRQSVLGHSFKQRLARGVWNNISRFFFFTDIHDFPFISCSTSLPRSPPKSRSHQLVLPRLLPRSLSNSPLTM